jgi:hypothetical protein
MELQNFAAACPPRREALWSAATWRRFFSINQHEITASKICESCENFHR